MGERRHRELAFKFPPPSVGDETAPPRRRQVAALVHRMGDKGLEILLITSRDTGRWIIPKGWRHKGRSRAKSALIEAYEEAGIRGTVRRKPVGTFIYAKWIDKKGRNFDCLVDVFSVSFKKLARSWPEQNERKYVWLRPDTAARRVSEVELKQLIRHMGDAKPRALRNAKRPSPNQHQ